MRLTIAIALFVAAAAAGSVSRLNTIAAQQPKTQWDGIYTEAQVRRGEPLYSEQCASCHGPDLTGGEMAPALTGSDFNSDWNDLPIVQLFDRIRTTMPQNSPGSLSRQQNADILALILSKGNYPAGMTELPTQAEVLNQITFKALKP